MYHRRAWENHTNDIKCYLWYSIQNWIKYITTSKGEEGINQKGTGNSQRYTSTINNHPRRTQEGLIFTEHLQKQKIEWSPSRAATHLLLTVTVINIITYNLQVSQLRLKTMELENLRAGIWTQPNLTLVIIKKINHLLLTEKIKS